MTCEQMMMGIFNHQKTQASAKESALENQAKAHRGEGSLEAFCSPQQTQSFLLGTNAAMKCKHHTGLAAQAET